ncbi:MAG TPA: serine hydrolase, partial [Prosthecobacter sp.]|nr:serine hydrolase [Prosthecobacter sp.]
MVRPFLLFICLAGVVASGAEPFDPAALKDLEATLDKAIAKKTPAGAVLWLEREDQKVSWVKGARALAPAREEMTADTIFDAASLTKVMATAPAIMILHEQGKVELDAPVQRYLAGFTGEGREEIRIRHLLTHTSGLKPGIPKDPPWSGYEEGIRRAVASVPEAPPETFFRYSDINFILLGEVVRAVSGQSLDAYAQQQVFTPLKMEATRFLPPAEWQARIAPTEKDEHDNLLRGVVHDPTARRMGGVAGHAGVFTSMSDVVRFARMALRGGEMDGIRILKEETVRKMQAVQTPITVLERRGLGWDIESFYSKPRGQLFPGGSFGHTGFTGNSLWIDPFSKSFVVFLSSRLHPQGGGSVRELYEEIGTAAAKCIRGFDFKQVSGAIPKREPTDVPTVLNGVDVLERDGFGALSGLRVGLITNHTGINAERVSTIDLLHRAPKVKLRALFSPEHGIRGALDQAKIGDEADK